MKKQLREACAILVGRRSLAELEAHSRSLLSRPDTRTKREHVAIAAIDDQAFGPIDTLRAAGFNVSFLGNTSDPRSLRRYQIILCDVRGVASETSSEEGVFLIKEMRKMYPEMFVVAYTAAAPYSSLARAAAENADAFISKSATPDKWMTVLDPIIDLALSPYEIWQRVRLALVQRHIDAYDLALLEQDFIRSALAGKKDAFERAICTPAVPTDVRPILQGVAASAIWALITALGG
jgi:DNA-binding NarL/FixJ family response regulator